MRGKKIIVLLSMTGLLGGMLAGCGSGSAPEDRTASDSGVIMVQGTNMNASQDMSQGSDQGASPDEDRNESREEGNGSEGRWQILDPETAAVVDADFMGVVWKLDKGSFYIVEEHVEILEDGSLLGAHPSPDAEIHDSELIQVVYDENTHFYVRSIINGGESYEDTEAGYQDVEEQVSVDLKGQFADDIFYAAEVRINKVL